MLYYVTTASGWADGAGWQYTDEVLETGEVESMDMMDMESFVRDYFNNGQLPKAGYDVKYTVSLYKSKESYEEHEAPVEVQNT